MASPTDDRVTSSFRIDRAGERGGVVRGLLALIGLAAVVVVVLVVVIANKTSDGAKQDVTVRTCAASSTGNPRASGVVQNHSSKTSNYVIRIKFIDAQGNAVSDGLAPVKSVGANRTATWELTGDRGATGKVSCEITGVTRIHLPGQ